MDLIQENIVKFLEALVVDDYSKASTLLEKVVKAKLKKKTKKAIDEIEPFKKSKNTKLVKKGFGKESAFGDKDLPKSKAKKFIKEDQDLNSPVVTFNLKSTLKGGAKEGYDDLHSYKGHLNATVFPTINKVNDTMGDVELSLDELAQLNKEVLTLSSKLAQKGDNVSADYLNELSDSLDRLVHLNAPDIQTTEVHDDNYPL